MTPPALTEHALAANTQRALRADALTWSRWCAAHGEPERPARPAAVATFLAEMATTHARATVARYAYSIAHLHRERDLASPCDSAVVRATLRGLARTTAPHQRQAHPLNRATVDAAVAAAGASLLDRRDVAMLLVAYDTLCRRSELCALTCADVIWDADGSAVLRIRRSKTDPEGEGMVRYCAPDTAHALGAWLAEAGTQPQWPLFCVIRQNRLCRTQALGGPAVVNAFKRLVRAAGIDPVRISGHSTRVGAAQDMAAAGLALPEIMQAGGWRTATMVARYTEQLDARRGAAAKLAALQGRAPKTGGE